MMEQSTTHINITDISGTKYKMLIEDVTIIRRYFHLVSETKGRQALPTGALIPAVSLTTKGGKTINVPRGAADNDKALLDLCLAVMFRPTRAAADTIVLEADTAKEIFSLLKESRRNIEARGGHPDGDMARIDAVLRKMRR